MLLTLEMRSRLQLNGNELDEEFGRLSTQINEGKNDFSDNEQVIISSWLGKLSEVADTAEAKIIRNEYAWALSDSVKKKQLSNLFNEFPPEGELLPFPKRKMSFSFKPPCQSSRPIRSTCKSKKSTRNFSLNDDLTVNEFEDPEEMAKVIARSKGQSLAKFVCAISRHTADFGQELHRAMKLETISFREYVDNVLSQRIRDLTEILNEEQNRELKKIKKDVNKWKIELALVKRRIEEMIPEFDLDEYKSDKNYLKKMFQIKPEIAEEDSFEKWKEESSHRLKWITDKLCKTTQANEEIMQEISNKKYETAALETQESVKQQNYLSHINCEMSDYKALLSEREKLLRGNNELLNQLKSMID